MSDFQILLDEIREIRAEVREVRTADIPSIKIEIAKLKRDASLASKLYAGIGTALATGTAIALKVFSHGSVGRG